MVLARWLAAFTASLGMQKLETSQLASLFSDKQQVAEELRRQKYLYFHVDSNLDGV